MKKIVLPLALAMILSACNNFGVHNRYQLIASSDGRVYRLDTKTGDISVISQNTISKIPDSNEVNLIVGLFYKTEDGNVIKYVGKGKFIPPDFNTELNQARMAIEAGRDKEAVKKLFKQRTGKDFPERDPLGIRP